MLSHFSGSYDPSDVNFLLTRLHTQPIDDVDEKERLIQSGEKHYSEIIGRERLPSAEYFDLYEQALETYAPRVAADVLGLAQQLVSRRGRDITLVSLARAGTPIGVLLKRTLQARFGVHASHYSISIIRDRGIDEQALLHILKKHSPRSICFIDGWTGKGAITRELESSVSALSEGHGFVLNSDLFVLSDLAGLAAASGSHEDYIIPSSILNAPVSGLISRTILNEEIGESQFHGCLYYDEWESVDRSRDFLQRIEREITLLEVQAESDPEELQRHREARRVQMAAFIQSAMIDYGVNDWNLIKPGIGEATRAVLRRSPERVILRAPDSDVQHLQQLCDERNVAVSWHPDMPVKALALIRRLGDV